MNSATSSFRDPSSQCVLACAKVIVDNFKGFYGCVSKLHQKRRGCPFVIQVIVQQRGITNYPFLHWKLYASTWCELRLTRTSPIKINPPNSCCVNRLITCSLRFDCLACFYRCFQHHSTSVAALKFAVVMGFHPRPHWIRRNLSIIRRGLLYNLRKVS